MRTRLFILIAVALFIITAIGCGRFGNGSTSSEIQTTSPRADATPAIAQLSFGNPSNASPDDRDNLLIVRDHYAMSYNDSRGTLNWTAWFTRRSDVGDRIERPMFETDPLLPDEIRRIKYYDYSGSGYDRGHMIPSADRFGDKRKNADTFYMTNIVPQTPSLNQFRWNALEMFARNLVFRGNTIYTVAGVHGIRERIKNRVTAPEFCWKVIAIFPRGDEKISRSTQLIAVWMPNVDGNEDNRWFEHITTVRQIEADTGYDLFSSVDRDIQDQLELRRFEYKGSR